MIKELYELVTEIQNTSGTNDKKAILLQNSSNQTFKTYLKYLIDPNLKYGIREKKLQKYRGKVKDEITFNDLFDCYEYLLKNNTGRDEDVKLTQAYIESEDEQYQDFLTKSITKTLKLGIEKKSIIKCLPGLIDDFDVMRAKSYHDYVHKLNGIEFILDEKKNGIRCIIRKENGTIVPRSRQNKVINGLLGIILEINTLPDGVYEGELLIKNAEELNHQDILQRTVEIVNNQDNNNKILDYWLFDYTTLDEFDSNIKSRNYFERHDTLHELINTYKFENVKVIHELYRGKDLSVVQPLLEKYVHNGREGLVYHKNKPYKKGKTDYTLKVKMQYTSDLRVIDFKPGKPHTKLENTLGTLIVDYKGFELGVGSMPDNMRDEIWNNKDKYLGRVAEISHFEESRNSKGGVSVSYPSFVRWREEGKQVDYAHE